jgi:ABC-type branched-subunit amino acid transport system ATPase component
VSTATNGETAGAGAPAGALLEIDHLFAGYNDVPVVRDLTLHVAPGEIVALLGPNGAGKTTTLLTTSALNPIIKGDIRVFGRSVKGRRAHLVARDGLAHVLEDRSLFFQLTVHENLELGSARGTVNRRWSTSRRCETSRAGAPDCCRVVSSRCSRWRAR